MNITIQREGQNYGPYTLDQINEYLGNGTVSESDWVWYEGCTDWLPVRDALSLLSPPALPPLPKLPTLPSMVETPSPITFAKLHQLGPPGAGQKWTNSLGMKFVPAGTDGVLFSIWDVRVKDFKAFVDATGYDATEGMYSIGSDGPKQRGDTWKSPGFKQTEDHPVVGVSWEDAKAFCQWLTKNEQAEGQFASNQEYRLPTDAEWSKAVGLNESSGGTPKNKHWQLDFVYPWGTQWPPPSGTGNYAGSEAKDEKWPSYFETIPGYDDGYPRTSPVGSFTANCYGLYDMGGNVWQWCWDKHEKTHSTRVLRGASWCDGTREYLLSAYRASFEPEARLSVSGFRVVLALNGKAQDTPNELDESVSPGSATIPFLVSILPSTFICHQHSLTEGFAIVSSNGLMFRIVLPNPHLVLFGTACGRNASYELINKLNQQLRFCSCFAVDKDIDKDNLLQFKAVLAIWEDTSPHMILDFFNLCIREARNAPNLIDSIKNTTSADPRNKNIWKGFGCLSLLAVLVFVLVSTVFL